jgi:hypothetical protein
VDVGAVAVEDHGVSEHETKCGSEVDAQLNDLAQSDGYLLLIDGAFEALDLPGFLDDSQLEERLVELLAFGAEEDIEKIVDDSRLSLQVGLFAHVGHVLFLVFFFLVFWVIELINKRFQNTIVKLNGLRFLLRKLLDRSYIGFSSLNITIGICQKILLLLHPQLSCSNLIHQFLLSFLFSFNLLNMIVENNLDLFDASLFLNFIFVKVEIIDYQLSVHFHEFFLVHFVTLEVKNLELSEVSEVLVVDNSGVDT